MSHVLRILTLHFTHGLDYDIPIILGVDCYVSLNIIKTFIFVLKRPSVFFEQKTIFTYYSDELQILSVKSKCRHNVYEIFSITPHVLNVFMFK